MSENKREKIVFLCTQNSARSQMAEGLMRHYYGEHFEIYSAGTTPYKVNPFAIQAMKNAGIDISSHYSKSIDHLAGIDFDTVITVCDNARENCPYIPGGKKYIHHNFSDPASVQGNETDILTEFERVRDEIKEWLEDYFNCKK